MLRTMVNPARVRFFHDVLVYDLQLEWWRRSVLDVGCGGGLLAEEFAMLGLEVTGLDPSVASLITARNHAREPVLDIEYLAGTGEKLPFANGSFDVVVC